MPHSPSKLKQKRFWPLFSQEILNQKQLIFFSVFTGILCFGFAITHFSIGIDDPARNYYLYSHSLASMIQQGRLMHVAFNFLTHSVQFIPFFTDFVGAVLYVVSALLFCGVFQYITDSRLSPSALIAFSCVYISSSILAEKFIYQLDVIVTMLSYCCAALAMLYAYQAVKEKRLGAYWKATVLLMMTVSSYESFTSLYICSVFSVFLLEGLVNQEKLTLRKLLNEGLRYAGILFAALILYYGLVYLLQAATGQLDIFQRMQISWPEGLGTIEVFKLITKRIYVFFQESIAVRYLPILMFCFFSLMGAGLCAWSSIRGKNFWLLCCFLGLFASNFITHYGAGYFLSRAAQTFCFFCGFVMLLLISLFHPPICKKLLCAVAALLVFVQSADMNRWFYNDYVRYQKESYAIHTLASKLLATCDTDKPVVFTNAPYSGYLDTELYPGRQVNGNSLLYWCGYAFQNKEQPFVAEVFRMYGYDFIQSPTGEQFDAACLEAETMPPWPKDGSVQEFDDFIVVNFS